MPTSRPDGGSLFELLHRGFYPRIHDLGLDAQEWLAAYHQTYLERDVRALTQVGDLESFGRYVRLCAGRCGGLLNLASLASDAGISHDTARRWLSILEASFVVFLLRPHHRSFNKRLVKSPKLYFYDSGLLCFLLGIRAPDQLRTHPLRGAVFESHVIAEMVKNYRHRGRLPEVYFWRDHRGHEVDLVLDLGDELVAVEIKSGETVVSDSFRGLEQWRRISDHQGPSALIYGGDETFRRRGAVVYSWRQWG